MAVQEITACVEELIASSDESSELVSMVATLSQDASICTDDILFEIKGYHTKVSEMEEQITHFGNLAQDLKSKANGKIT